MSEREDAIVEKMARAIHDELYKDSPEDWRQDDYELMRAQFIREARAAYSVAKEEIERGLIEEMWEPSDDMMTAGVDATCRVWSRQGIRDCWQAMLDTFATTGKGE